MKKLVIAVAVGLISSGVYAACVGPYCYDDTGATIQGGVSLSGTVSNTAGAGLPSKSLAQIDATNPSAAGQLVYCNDCNPVNLCISSGTATGAYVNVSSKTVHCNAL